MPEALHGKFISVSSLYSLPLVVWALPGWRQRKDILGKTCRYKSDDTIYLNIYCTYFYQCVGVCVRLSSFDLLVM